MSLSPSPDSLKSFIVATYHRHNESELAPFARPMIAVSRETGSSGEEICKILAEKLGRRLGREKEPWAVFDRNLLQLVLKEMNLSEKVAEFLPEAGSSGIDAFVRELLGVHPSMWTMKEKTNETIDRLARVGNVIIVGRGAHLVTKKYPSAFAVRIVCPLEERVRRVTEREQRSNREEVRDELLREDKEKAEYLKNYFQRNIDDSHDYDLVLNTGHFTPEKAAGILEKAFLEFANQQNL